MSELNVETPKSAENITQPFRFTVQQQIVLFCCVGLITTFFAPWATIDTDVSAFGLQRYAKYGAALWIIPILSLITLLLYDVPIFLSRISVITSLAAWAGILYVLFTLGTFGLISLRWGASLTALFALGLFVFSARRNYSLPFDFVTKKLGSRKAEVYSHWGTLTPDLHFSTKDFYTQLESLINQKQWPGVQVLRVEYSEAGVLSHKREYLRIIRQRQVFDVCAATFGTDYFFSLREAEIPSVITVRAFLAILLSFLVLLGTLIQLLGLIFGLFALVFLLIFVVWFLFNILKLGLTKVDQVLLTFPVIGPVYENWFRSDTYFQQDTRIIFLQSVGDAVQKLVEETVSAKGLKLLNIFEKKPILDSLYKSYQKPL